MARTTATFACQSCGTIHARWVGRCDTCNEWNSIIEEGPRGEMPKGLGAKRGRAIEFVGLTGPREQPRRQTTGLTEFDRVCGGGLVRGSAILVGGDPGIGKSTILLQVSAAISRQPPSRCLYISGEEAVDQVRMRAERLDLHDAPVELAAATNVRDIATSLEGGLDIGLVVVDSIQTLFVDSLNSAPGTVAQVRTSAQELIRLAKSRGFALILIGHVTKDGTIAGPKVLEHMVDTVLYFEGDRGHPFRILRTVKNRFGPADEIGVFEMTDRGLIEVANPSELFIGDHDGKISGASVFAGIEGSRPMLVEIQALTSPTTFGTPRRAVVGWDSARLAMLLAVLEARCGIVTGTHDVYLNVAGGLRVTEPAADLAVATAIVSSLTGRPTPPKTVIFGEIGLSGEVRPVGQPGQRLGEATKLGFIRALIPMPGRQSTTKTLAPSGLTISHIKHLDELVAILQPIDGTSSFQASGGDCG